MKTATFAKIIVLAGMAAAITYGTLLAPRAMAAPAASSAIVIGSVDLDKILAGYAKKPAFDQQVQDLNSKLDAQFKQQVNYDMLTADQQKQLTALLSKPNPTDADKAQITQLQAQSDKDAQDLAALQQKQNPTADDQARLKALTQQHKAGQQALKDVADGYTQEVTDKQQALSTQLSDNVRLAIAEIAKDKGLTVVFTSQVALYCSNDITDDVLKKLNK